MGDLLERGAARPPALLLLASVAACSADLEIPQTARVGCTDGPGCPSGYVCKEAVGRCLPAQASDQEPPALLGEARIEPDIGTVGSTFRVCFDVSEPLAEVPAVSVDVGGRAVAMARDEEGSADAERPAHCYGYTAGGTEVQGGRAVTADLVDLGGNVSAGVAVGSLHFDFTPPRLAAAACECGGTFRAISEIHDPEVAEAILEALGLPSTPLPIAPARPPPVPTEEESAWAA